MRAYILGLMVYINYHYGHYSCVLLQARTLKTLGEKSEKCMA